MRTRRSAGLALRIAISAVILATAILPAASAQEQIYRVGGGVSRPVQIKRPAPEYTPEARAAKIEGGVVLEMVVNVQGTTEEIRVVKSLDPGLDRKAIEAVREWTFEPGRKDGKPVAVRVTIEHRFKLP